jgi:cytochrome c biogenesis protein CcmG/thiol:disulfide interchange protein DsbE
MTSQSFKPTPWKEAALVFAASAMLGAAMLSSGCSWLNTGSTPAKKNENATKMAIDFTAKNLVGREIRLSDFRGKVVLVNFWAVWCGPCEAEIPELVDLYNNYRDKGFVIVGVSDLSDLGDIKSFVAEHKMSYPVVVDPGHISDDYNVIYLPTSFLLDRDGRIVQKFQGYSPSLRRRLETQIQKLN